MLFEALSFLECRDQERAARAKFGDVNWVAEKGGLVAKRPEEVGIGVDVGKHPEDGRDDVGDRCETHGNFKEAQHAIV